MNTPDKNEGNNGFELIDISIMMNDFFRILRKKWLWLLLVIAIAAGSYAAYQKYSYVPYYTASSTFAINTSENGTVSGNYYDNSAAQQMARTFPYILTSDVLQRKVAQQLGLSYVPGRLQASVMNKTNFLTISVTDTDPQRSYLTLQTVLENYPSISESIVGKVYMELMDENGVPQNPDNVLNTKLHLFTGGLIGMVIGLFFVVVWMFTNRTIRCEDDCVKRANTKCLGVVPYIREKARSNRVRQNLNILKKNTDQDFVEAYRIVRNKIEHRASKGDCKSILVSSALAGEGKSTTAVNIALSLAQEGKKVALVDCDLRNPSDAAILSLPDGKGLIDFLQGNIKFEECVLRGEEFLPHKLPLLFVRGGKAVADGAKFLSSEKMKVLVSVLEKQMDYVILDTPPSGLLTDASILAQYAQGAIMVIKKDFAKVDKILEAMEHLTETNLEIIGCVLNGDN